MNPDPSEFAPHVVIETTADGSLTVLNTRTGSTYHSRHGAQAESMHVFIQAGLFHLLEKGRTTVSILEMGFGTGLNAFLTAEAVADSNIPVEYHALEAFPLEESVWSEVVANRAGGKALFHAIHAAEWERPTAISPQFILTKKQTKLEEFRPLSSYDLIYYDAFEPNVQPELWTEEVFQKLFALTTPGGVLVTYCAKGAVRRAMQAAGYVVERLPGPPFKREMLRATRTT